MLQLCVLVLILGADGGPPVEDPEVDWGSSYNVGSPPAKMLHSFYYWMYQTQLSPCNQMDSQLRMTKLWLQPD